MYISGIGIVSSLGTGPEATCTALTAGRSAIAPLSLFPLLHGQPLPVGQVSDELVPSPLPRTHRLALAAAGQVVRDDDRPPDAVIIGTTTGGILTSEELLRSGVTAQAQFRYHGLTSVAEEVARAVRCYGPALTVSTACSSGSVALTLALRLLQQGVYERILAGGADSLCRLTYFGFHSLQLVDRIGCRPLDQKRLGMSVAEGAALLLLTRTRPARPLAVLAGAGLSCDAHHPAAPHPDGDGALAAMQAALDDAACKPESVDYLNLHGTGTPDNDLAEAKAIHRLFAQPPPLSSVKGATGHSLAASGAIEAVLAALAVSRGLLPANTGCRQPDPALDLKPLRTPQHRIVTTVLSNSFGFGGNNCCLVLQVPPDAGRCTLAPRHHETDKRFLAIHDGRCLSGAGDTAATLERLRNGVTAAGLVDLSAAAHLPPRLVRRLKRLPRLALALAAATLGNDRSAGVPTAIFLGTGWGALSETHDFLERLASSNEQFPSPTDFVGSVHNAPASQIAIWAHATGANITVSGGNHSFEQALWAADLILDDHDAPALVLGVDEGHQHLSPLFDASIPADSPLADGGGALLVSRRHDGATGLISTPFYRCRRDPEAIAALLDWYGGSDAIRSRCGAILAGFPADRRDAGEEQLSRFLAMAGTTVPVLRYRELVGEYASASAVAAVLAWQLLVHGELPASLAQGPPRSLAGKTILLLTSDDYLSALEIALP
ncbi:beta-ketoacyl synthase N-terminal-like domain-containing protein [Desulfofustis limnaeus]|uniref:Ketosynthase family 3 (KS3) domain-containing protein n=1 Tax=Desulfofustis limnaeus TaxID=2740163 RepID=A0ABM7W5R3_9BACT|nr:beta-ketoacyl synthase N-terminal-like domain-containing protein [Desulfofustis limnaeus]MDX9895129.1 beta-ketoacyl synthase N-terminal-like domain-containing protein [Desulfofustis sp.]BDD86296.1 hypothetical protein DPPLL_06610 [Desulfofustis limnaeus]